MECKLIPKVSIILLNYNGADDTIVCLDSLNKISYKNYNIIIIDNASTDDSVARIKVYLLSLKSKQEIVASRVGLNAGNEISLPYVFLHSNYNGGYGHGNNVGIKHAINTGADYVLIINNDTIVDPGFLEPMVALCEGDNNIGIASAKIYYLDNPDTLWFNGGSYHPCTGRVKHFNWGEKDVGKQPLSEVTFITGCLWLIPKKIFKDVGFINEKYFMYVEDLEYCQRVLQSGYSLRVTMNSRIYHKVGSGSGGETTYFSSYWTTRNKLFFMKDNTRFICMPLFFFNNVIRFTLKWSLTGNFKLIKAQLMGIIDFLIKRDI